jgi:hypothetical protein
MKTTTWIAIIAAILLLCLGLSLIPLLFSTDAAFAQIRSDGQVIATVSLHKDQVLTVVGENGTNIVTVQGGKIAVTTADCPDHHCVNRGFCSSGPAIVCLPNRLVITFLGDTEIDGAVG